MKIAIFSAIPESFSVSAFYLLVGTPIDSSTVGLKICGITSVFETYKPIIKKKRKKRNKIVLLTKRKLNIIVLIHHWRL